MASSSFINSDHGKIPMEHFEYKYIEECTDVRYVERILTSLREEGFYPDLVRRCEAHLQRLNPRSPSLRKDNPPARLSDVPKDDLSEIEIDIFPGYWAQKRKECDTELKQQSVVPDDIPPIRSGFSITHGQNPKTHSSKRAVPRDYGYWDKFDAEKECAKVDGVEPMEEDPPAIMSSGRPKIESTVDATSQAQQEKLALANCERDKGNVAFKAGHYAKAVVYYSRSINATPTATAYSNSAQAKIKLQDWHSAMSDCHKALELEPRNEKVLFRRAEIHRRLRNFQIAAEDLRSLLHEYPQNCTVTRHLSEVEKLIEGQSQHQNKGKKIPIQEVEDEEEDDDHFGGDTFASLKREGDDFVEKAQYQDAAVKYSQCLKMNPKDPEGYADRAHCYLKLERFAEAKQDCDASLELKKRSRTLSLQQKKSARTFYKRAMAHKGLREYPACCSDLQAVLREDPNCREAERELEEVLVLHLTKISVSSAKRRRIVPVTEAEGDDEETMETAPVSGDRENRRVEEVNVDLHLTSELVRSPDAEKQCESGDGDVTMEEDTPAVAVDSGHPGIQADVGAMAWVNEQKLDSANHEKDRGNEAYRDGHYEQAVADYSRSIDIAQTVVAFNNRAQANIKLKQWRNAMDDCQTVLLEEPGNLKALLRRAEVHRSLGRFHMALDDVRFVLGEVPDNPAATKLLAEVQETLRESEGNGIHIPEAWSYIS